MDGLRGLLVIADLISCVLMLIIFALLLIVSIIDFRIIEVVTNILFL